MKLHEFNELINDIRFLSTYTLSQKDLENANRHLYYLLSRHAHLQDRSCNDVHEIWMQCVTYGKTQQLRAHIVKVLEKIGIKPDHEHTRRLEVAQAGFDMALSLKNARAQGPGPCLA